MASHSQLSLGPMEGKSIVPARTSNGAGVEQALDRPGSKDLFELIVEAVDETISEKEAAISLGLPDPAYWSNVKKKERPAPRCNRVTDLPTPTQRAACKRWAHQLGMRVSDEDTRRTALADAACAIAHALREIG